MPSSGEAQRYDFSEGFTRYSIEEGLSEGTVRSIEEDHLGFQWIATTFGLNRFDGSEFVNYTKLNTNDSLPGDQINDLLFDAENERMWIATSGGLVYYDLRPETGSGNRWVSVDRTRSFGRILQRNEHQLVTLVNIGFDTEVYLYDLRDYSWKLLPFGDQRISSLTMHPNQSRLLWSASDSYIKSVDLQTLELELNLELPVKQRLLRGSERLFWDTARDKLILSHGDIDNIEIDTLSGAFSQHPANDLLNDYFITSYLHLEGSRYLIGTSSHGMIDLDFEKGTTVAFEREEDNSRSLSNSKVYFLKKDKSGGIWIGTDDGLNLYDPDAFLFRNATIELTPYRSSPIVHSAKLTDDLQGIIACGSFSLGGKLHNIQSGESTHFDFVPNGGSQNANYSYFQRSPRGDYYWMNTTGIVKKVGKTEFELIFSFEKNLPDLKGQYIHSFVIDDRERLLILTYNDELIICDDGEVPRRSSPGLFQTDW